MKSGKLFVLSAPSGAGKTTLKDLLIKRFPQLGYSISVTTRPPRKGEQEGKHYFFKTLGQFKAMVERDELLEYNQVHGNYYGTPRAYIESSLMRGQSLVLDIDVYGKTNFDKAFPDSVGILIVPPDMRELEKRLRKRNTDNEETVKIRMENAEKELKFARTEGKFEYTVVNNQLEDALARLQSILAQELGQGAFT